MSTAILESMVQIKRLPEVVRFRRPDLQLSVSHNKVGDVLVAQGNLAPALDSYRASLAIFERLAAADPGNAEWQRDVIVSNVKLAEIVGRAGESGAARAHYQAAMSIALELQASGRLAPRDAWMVGELERRLGAAAGKP